MKASIITLLAAAAAVTAQTGYTTSTVRETQTLTVTSCAPTVTNCPAGPHVTTVVVDLYTTVCPVTATEITPPKYPTTLPAGPAASSSTVPVRPPYTSTVTPALSQSLQPTSVPAAIVPVVSPSPILSTITISTCIPTIITSVITVVPSSSVSGVASYSGAASSTGGAPAAQSTPASFISGAGSNTVASLLLAAGLFVAVM